jgi:hypothetical protein
LVQAALNPKAYPRVKESTFGVIFFATPHQGGNGVTLAQVVSNAIIRLSGRSTAKNDILSTLNPTSLYAEALTRNFSSQLEDYQFLSFFETKVKRLKKPGGFGWVKLVSQKLVIFTICHMKYSTDKSHNP